jgi:hypothetical protein
MKTWGGLERLNGFSENLLLQNLTFVQRRFIPLAVLTRTV